jgi:hypothetical protein
MALPKSKVGTGTLAKACISSGVKILSSCACFRFSSKYLAVKGGMKGRYRFLAFAWAMEIAWPVMFDVMCNTPAVSALVPQTLSNKQWKTHELDFVERLSSTSLIEAVLDSSTLLAGGPLRQKWKLKIFVQHEYAFFKAQEPEAH